MEKKPIKKRTLVCSDLHGNFKGLKQCLERSNFDYENDQLICLGDICDGHSQTVEVILELLKIKNLIYVRGNHDCWLYDWLRYGDQPLLWTEQGGRATIKSFVNSGQVLNPDILDFLEKGLNYYIDSEERLFIHGGFDYLLGFPTGALKKLGIGAGSLSRQCHWDRALWAGAIQQYSFQPTAEVYNPTKEFKEVFIGHSATTYHNIKPHFPEYNDPNQAKNGSITVPMTRFNVTNLDTGGGYVGKITIMDIDTKEYWQSDFGDELYPEFKGR